MGSSIDLWIKKLKMLFKMTAPPPTEVIFVVEVSRTGMTSAGVVVTVDVLVVEMKVRKVGVSVEVASLAAAMWAW